VFDLKVGGRMLVKYPGLTTVGGLAIAFAIWAGLVIFQVGSLFTNPTLPLSAGARLIEIRAIDVAANQIKINDLKTKKPITIMLKPDSVLRRWPENMTAMFGGGMGPGAGGPARAGAGPGPGQPQNPGQAPQRPQGAGPGGPQGGGPRGGGMNVADMLERLPTISINEVKVGDMIIMSSLPGSDPTQFTAISLVTGVEPLLTMVAARQQTGGAQGRPQGVDLNGSFGGMFGGVGVP